MYFFELVGDTVWGATAAMLRQMLARLTGTDPGWPIDTDPARDTPPGFRLTPEEEPAWSRPGLGLLDEPGLQHDSRCGAT